MTTKKFLTLPVADLTPGEISPPPDDLGIDTSHRPGVQRSFP